MGKEGKTNLLFVLVASLLILLVYVVFVSGIHTATSDAPIELFNFTSQTIQFNCTATVPAANTTISIINISLFSNLSGTYQEENTTGNDGDPFLNLNNTLIIFNETNVPEGGIYVWTCVAYSNQTADPVANETNSGNRTFNVDISNPSFISADTNNLSDASPKTGDTIGITINATDSVTGVKNATLLRNGTQVASSAISNNGRTNLTYVIASSDLNHVYNFTINFSDFVAHTNVTDGIIVTVSKDGTPPGPITLNSPIDLFNQSSATVIFNFTAVDNNASTGALTCSINISQSGTIITSLANIAATNGTPQINSTTFSNGTYQWSVNCTDGGSNVNTSLASTFTVDNIPPIFDFYNITDTANLNASGHPGAVELGNSVGTSTAQGRTIYLVANWTDNLTKPLRGDWQVRNHSSDQWVTINESNITPSANGGWLNLSFTIPTGHNIYEGKNLSFRIRANDTLGNLNSTGNFSSMILVNDTTAPTIVVNKPTTNLSNFSRGHDIEINWTITDNNPLVDLNWSVDDATTETGDCKNFKSFPTQALADPKKKHNFTLHPLSCNTNLTSDFHKILIQARDSWGNVQQILINFTVDTNAPTISLDVTNNTNMTTLSTGITVTNTDDLSGFPTTKFTTSCDASGNYTSGTTFFPFNDSSGACTGADVQTLTITATDGAGNSNVSSFLFGVDDTAPIVTAINPTNGTVLDQVVDGVSALNYSVKDVFGKISFIGYYLDDDTSPTQLNFSESGLGSVNVDFFGNLSSINFTGGSHTLIFTANDSVGNWKNTTVTFTVRVPIPLADWKLGLNVTLGTEVSTSPVFRVKNDSGDYNIKTDSQLTNETYEIIINVNSTGTPFNVTLTDLNGSSASWDKINSTYIRSNNTEVYNGIQNNWTNTILQMVYVNGSIDEFTGNDNTYFGTIIFPVNFSLVQEFWWMQDETDLQSRQNITQQCGTSAFTATTLTPCWNYTSSGRTLIRVPHFSIVVAVNDSGAPTITVNNPIGNQTVSSFRPNITVTSDAISCVYSVNSSVSNVTMTKTGTECIGDIESFKNKNDVDNIYNITFTVNDSSGNIATGIIKFNVSDNTKPNTPNSSRVTTSVGTTTATITITANESVNANVSYGTAPGTLTSTKQSSSFSTTFSASQSVSLSSLSASTLYHFNVTVCDFNNNCIKNGTFNFTTSAAAATTTPTTTTTTGGGGGSPAVSNIADSKGQLWSTIPSGSSVSLNIDKTTIAVTSVEVNNVKSDLRNVDLEVASLKDNPVSADAAAKVYQYFRINKKNIVDSDAESFKISFRVTKTWLTDNGLTSGDISLYRYKSGWNELTTTVLGTDSTYVNYEADTPGFSSFAIGVKSSVEVAEEVPEGEAPEEVPEGEVAPPEPVEAPEPVVAPGKAPVAWIIAAIVIILGIVLIVVYQKKKQQQI